MFPLIINPPSSTSVGAGALEAGARSTGLAAYDEPEDWEVNPAFERFCAAKKQPVERSASVLAQEGKLARALGAPGDSPEVGGALSSPHDSATSPRGSLSSRDHSGAPHVISPRAPQGRGGGRMGPLSFLGRGRGRETREAVVAPSGSSRLSAPPRGLSDRVFAEDLAGATFVFSTRRDMPGESNTVHSLDDTSRLDSSSARVGVGGDSGPSSKEPASVPKRRRGKQHAYKVQLRHALQESLESPPSRLSLSPPQPNVREDGQDRGELVLEGLRIATNIFEVVGDSEICK